MSAHRYEVGQKLFCFEPDSSKAKVVYLAKILKHVHRRSSVPYYTVHFQGWKGKWDREVPENLLLENTEFNRMLKKKIDEIVRNVRCRVKRKQRIDQILEIAAVSADDIDWDKIPGIWNSRQKKQSRKSRSGSGVTLSTSEKSTSDRGAFLGSTCSEDSDATTLDEEDTLQLQYETLPVHRYFTVPVQLPVNLRLILDAHLNGIIGNSEYGWCSVLQVLQSYVDGFPYAHTSSMPSTQTQEPPCPERASRVLGPAYLKTDQNRVLCADTCSSLRVLFDCNLESYLLPTELKVGSNKFRPFPYNGHAFPLGTHMPSAVQSMYRYSSPRYELLPEIETQKSPELPCLNYPAHYLLRVFVNISDLLNTLPMTACRRAIVTRHLVLLLDYLERTRSFWFAKATPHHTSHMSRSPQGVPSEVIQGSAGNRSKMQTATKTTSESSSSTEPQTEISDRTRRALRREHPIAVQSTSLVKMEEHAVNDAPVSPSSSRSAKPTVSYPLREIRSSSPLTESRSRDVPVRSGEPDQEVRQLRRREPIELGVQSNVIPRPTRSKLPENTSVLKIDEPVRITRNSLRLSEEPVITRRSLRPRM
ncbi:hypothetical protein CSKR_104446 [Clonorchis sinensis]|uniref:Male-specific lethal 3-like protein n=1 Tax=Clonorchis sinensis TaxID=79923 RepID=A0A8T1MEP9_CLOSI|nr:hypothetical protein CSKR_104446 [Clonorchis sinensis]